MSGLCLQAWQRLCPWLHWNIWVGGPISSWHHGHSSSRSIVSSALCSAPGPAPCPAP